MRTGPLVALSTVAETLPKANRFTLSSPRLPTATSVRSPCSSAASWMAAAGSAVATLVSGSFPRTCSSSVARSFRYSLPLLYGSSNLRKCQVLFTLTIAAV